MLAIYDENKHKLMKLSINNQPVKDDQLYTILLQGYHFKNSLSYLSVSSEELEKSGKSKTIVTSAQEVFKEYLVSHQNLSRSLEGRLTYIS